MKRIVFDPWSSGDPWHRSANVRRVQTMRIYVASSWRNQLQPSIVAVLQGLGHEVYDFRHPAPGQKGFAWSDIDPEWLAWDPAKYREALKHPIAEAGYALDIGALRACEAIVYVLPCGRSASWEFGYAMGQGKRGYVVSLEPCEPELMFREATIITSMHELVSAFWLDASSAVSALR